MASMLLRTKVSTESRAITDMISGMKAANQ